MVRISASLIWLRQIKIRCKATIPFSLWACYEDYVKVTDRMAQQIWQTQKKRLPPQTHHPPHHQPKLQTYYPYPGHSQDHFWSHEVADTITWQHPLTYTNCSIWQALIFSFASNVAYKLWMFVLVDSRVIWTTVMYSKHVCIQNSDTRVVLTYWIRNYWNVY